MTVEKYDDYHSLPYPVPSSFIRVPSYFLGLEMEEARNMIFGQFNICRFFSHVDSAPHAHSLPLSSTL